MRFQDKVAVVNSAAIYGSIGQIKCVDGDQVFRP